MATDDFERHPLFFAGRTWDDAEDWNDPDSWAKAYQEDLRRSTPIGWVPRDWRSTGEASPYWSASPRRRACREGPVIRHCGSSTRVAAARTCRTRWHAWGAMSLPSTSRPTRRLNDALHPHRLRGRWGTPVVEVLGDRGSRVGRPGAPTGSVSHRTHDWFDDALAPGSFQAIYVSNSLRLSRKPYWRRWLSAVRRPSGTRRPPGRALHERLGDPRGGVRAGGGRRVPARRRPAGVPQEPPRRPEHKRFVGIWPTVKSDRNAAEGSVDGCGSRPDHPTRATRRVSEAAREASPSPQAKGLLSRGEHGSTARRPG